MSPRYDVFLSHSSSDKPVVEELARRLVEAGIAPFLDKWHLVPGEPWQEALEQALDASGTCAIFLGSSGIGTWHHEEMRSALETRVGNQAFRVIPVLLPGSFEPRKEQLPRFLRRLTWVDFRGGLADPDAFHRLLSGIRGTAPGPGGGGEGGPAKPRSMAQPPEAFVHRREYDEVLEALCPPAGAAQPATVGITTALRGAGGFGKTDLAQAICQNPRVWQTYPHGILWTTMGEDIDAHGRLSRVRDLIRWWTQEEAPAFETVTAAGARLRELLAGSRVLIVLDDVWSSADVTPFQGLAKGSALLVTTRDRQTLPADSHRIDVDAMASHEAVSLLRMGLPAGSAKEFQSLAARLGEWPLLLKLVNRQLRELVNEDGLSLSKALQEIEQALDSEGFSAFDRDDKDSRHAAASQAILVSVRRLPEKERDLYFQLAIFPEDAQIPLSVLGRFWGISQFQTRKFCRRLHELSLLLEFDGETGTIRLHDVVRRVLIEQVGRDLPSLHGRLLDLFQPANGLWSELPVEESYLWRTLGYHFLGAERREQFWELLCNFPFLGAKLKATDVNALIADYETFSGEEARLVGDAIRLSAHVLASDRRQLAPQLVGRLKARNEESIQSLVRGAESWRGGFWLRPRTASLVQPGGALIRVLEGHTREVSAVALVNGRRAVSSSDDGTVRMWDLETGQTLRAFEGHLHGVSALAVLDSQCVISAASSSEVLQVWSLETGQVLTTLRGHTGSISSVAVLASQRAISASQDRTLRVWQLKTGRSLKILEGHTRGINQVAVVDGGRAISASYDRTLRLWDLRTGQTLKTFVGHTEGVTAVAVVDSRHIISASYDGTLRLWDLKTGQTLKTLDEHMGTVRAVAVLNGRRAIIASADGTLRVWDLETGQTLRPLEGHTDGVNAVAVVDDGRAVSASEDGTLRVWNLEAGPTFRALEEHRGEISAVAVVDCRLAVSASDDKTLRIWDLETGQSRKTLKGHEGGVSAVAVVDCRRAISASHDRTLRIWDLETGQSLGSLLGHTDWVSAVAVVNGRRAVSASDETLTMWDLETGQNLKTLIGHTGRVRAMAALAGCRAVSASDDRTLRVWDLETGQTLRTLVGHTGRVRAVVVIDSRRAVSASDDRTLRVWDLETGHTLKTLVGHRDWVHTVAAVNGRLAVSASSDRTLRVWDLETGRMQFMTRLDALVFTVATTPDCRIVVAGDSTGRMHFFDLVEPT